MKVEYINSFIVAARHVFDTMIHVPLALGKPYIKEQDERLYKVSASVNVAGAIQGIVVMSFSQPVALALASGLIKEPIPTLDADCLDALGEVSSMIVGNAKKDFTDGLVRISIPKVATSPAEIHYPQNLPVIVIPCDTSPGRFIIEVAFRMVNTDGSKPRAVAA